MAVDPARAKSLFLAASDLADRAERTAYLDRECAADTELRARVEALLRVNDAAPLPPREGDGTSAHVAERLAPTEDYDDPAARIGSIIAGKYALLQVIGEGGMGSVWRARQSEPVKRNVAVKLIKAGMDSRQVVARFEAERQALALMDHPNIAKVLDGGLHQGRPYFVMELVKGTPITEYCDSVRLTPKERLELFVPVCQAIQHAHLKGIIHRDIKPSNVLVALYDDRPVVKVIDFGVAKATGGTLTEQTIETGFGGVVGTPQYMSPEQATFNNLDVDTRSDVYALGVLLYELLTGSPPFSRQELERRGLLEMLRIVREEEPPRPSNRLSTAEALPTLSANRGTEPKKLTGLLRNDLDWIVMKALEKDRARRYETANGFAADVLRYLAGEAVHAHPPSAAYRTKKFVRRHKSQVIASGLVVAALLTGIVGTTVGLFEAKRQEKKALGAADAEREAKKREAERAEGERRAKELAETKRQEAEQQQKRAQEETKRADRERQVAQAVTDFLQNKLLAQADTTAQADALLRAGGTSAEAKLNPTIRELLDRAAKELAPDRIEAHFPNRPLVQGQILATVGNSYRGIGEVATAIDFFKRSEALYRQQLGPDHPDALASKNNLSYALLIDGKLDLALPMCEDALKRARAKLDPDSPCTIQCMNHLSLAYHLGGKHALAVPLSEETLKLRKAKLGPDHPKTIESMDNLGVAYRAAGRLDAAVPLIEEALKLYKAKLGVEHPGTINCMNNLAVAYREAGKLDLALPLFEETLKLSRAKLGPGHFATLYCVGNFARAYEVAGKFDLALPLFEESLKFRKAKLGPEHRDTLNSMKNLARAYRAAGKPNLAQALYEESFKLTKATLGADHPDTLWRMNSLASSYLEADKFDLALPLFEALLKHHKAKSQPDDPNTLAVMNNLALTYRGLKRFDLALPLLERMVPIQKQNFGRTHPDTQWTVASLGLTYMDLGRAAEALPFLEETYRASKKDASLPKVGEALLAAYVKSGKPAETAKLIDELLADARKKPPKDSPQLAELLAQSGTALLVMTDFAKAEPLLRESLTIREKSEPDAWTTFQTRSLLGGVLAGRKKYADAEPLLRTGYEGMMAREKAIPLEAAIVIPEALDRLVGLYNATNKVDKALSLLQEAFTRARARLGPDHLQTLTAMHNLAAIYRMDGKPDKALPLFEQAFAGRKAKLGPDHPDTLKSMIFLAGGYKDAGRHPRALPLYEDALRLQKARLGPDHPDTFTTINNLAHCYWSLRRLDRSLPLFEGLLPLVEQKLGRDHPTTLSAVANLGVNYKDAGQADKALPLLEEALERRKAKLGPDHPDTLASMNALAEVYRIADRTDKALPLYEEALALAKAKFGPDHLDTLASMNNVATGFYFAGKPEKALPLFEKAVAGRKAKLGPDHPDTLMSMFNLGRLYQEGGQLGKALPLMDETLTRRKARLGPDHPDTLMSMGALAACHRVAGQLDKALPLYEEALALTKAKLGAGHPDTFWSMHNLASCYSLAQRPDKAVPLLEELLPLREKKLGRSHEDTLRTVGNLGVVYKDSGRLAEAIPLLEEAHRASRKRAVLRFVDSPLLDAYARAGQPAKAAKLLGDLLADARRALPADSPELAGKLARAGLILMEMKGFAEAEPLLRECLEIRAKNEPASWTTFNTQSMLGGVLLGQKKYADAEPLLLKGYEGMKAREKSIPPPAAARIPEAIDRLIELYAGMTKPDEVKKWKAERAKHPLQEASKK